MEAEPVRLGGHYASVPAHDRRKLPWGIKQAQV
jgi:hypothetical protein